MWAFIFGTIAVPAGWFFIGWWAHWRWQMVGWKACRECERQGKQFRFKSADQETAAALVKSHMETCHAQ